MAALGVAARARRRRAAAGRRCASSTGPTRRARASAAACSAPRPCAGTLDPDDVRDLRDREGDAPGGRVGACDVDLRRRRSGRRAARRRARLPRAAHRAGPGARGARRAGGGGAGTVGVERHLCASPGRPRTRAPRRCTCGATRSLAAARAALEIREVGLATRAASARPSARAATRASSPPSPAARSCCSTSATSTPASWRRCSPRRTTRAGRPPRSSAARSSSKHLWSIPPIPFDERLIGLAKEARRQGHRDPCQRPAPRRGRDGAADPDGDDLLQVLAAGLAHARGGHAGGGPKVAIEAYGATVAATLAAAAAGELPPVR